MPPTPLRAPARRQFLALALGAALVPAALRAQPGRMGHLVVIGGAEDRVQEKHILKRYVELAGTAPRIVVLAAASEDPQSVWRIYEPAFRELGVVQCELLPLFSRDDALNPDVAEQILQADGLFLSGGDQSRLMDCLWNTPAARAIHQAFHLYGCCIGGTSAGAAALSRHMLAWGTATKVPEKGAIVMDLGLGLMPNVIIDQHFAERHRFSRLLSAVARRPDLLGLGVDEDTALVIRRGQAVEVLGSGAVTVVDGRRMTSDYDALDDRESIEITGLELHVLPAGRRYGLQADPQGRSRFVETLQRLAEPGPLPQ